MERFIETIKTILKATDGYKTYVVGALMILLGIYNSDNQMILEGIGLISLRRGVATDLKPRE